MNQLRSVRAILLAAVLLVAGQLPSMPVSFAAYAGDLTISSKTIAVPDGSVLLFIRQARGAQVYECQNGQWVFRAPRAQLFDPQAKKPTGVHYGGIDRGLTPGPWWESTEDGSRIRGSRLDSAPSPNPDSIPLLLLEVVERQGAGVFSPVSYIQRLNTVGGDSPTGKCDSGDLRSVPYTADYYFYAAP